MGGLLSTLLADSRIVSGKVNNRYDYIAESSHWDLVDVQYRYEEAIKHGSDHALVIAELDYLNCC